MPFNALIKSKSEIALDLTYFFLLAPPPPSSFECVLTEDCKVQMTWSTPKQMKFIYPINLYAVYASVGKIVCVSPISVFSKTSLIVLIFYSRAYFRRVRLFSLKV